MHRKCQEKKSTYHLFFTENEHQTQLRKVRKKEKQLLLKPGIHNQIKDEA